MRRALALAALLTIFSFIFIIRYWYFGRINILDEAITRYSTRLNEKIAEWKPSQYRPLMFGANVLWWVWGPDLRRIIDGQIDVYLNELEADFVTLYLSSSLLEISGFLGMV